MLKQLRTLRTQQSEEGFTLIELMITVVIIGILAAIAIPIFANQQEEALVATMKSDVRNTATEVATFLTKKPTATVEELHTAGFVGTTSEGNLITVAGTWDNYTITGVNPAAKDRMVCFLSVNGRVSEDGCLPASPVPGSGQADNCAWNGNDGAYAVGWDTGGQGVSSDADFDFILNLTGFNGCYSEAWRGYNDAAAGIWDA